MEREVGVRLESIARYFESMYLLTRKNEGELRWP